MRTGFFIFLALILWTAAAHGQATTDSLKMKGHKFIYRHAKLTVGETLYIIPDSTEAHKEMQVAFKNYSYANVCGFAGGFLIGYGVVQGLVGEEINWALAGTGAAVALCSIPFTIAFKEHARKAMDLHNAEISKPRSTGCIFYLQPRCNGLNLAMRF